MSGFYSKLCLFGFLMLVGLTIGTAVFTKSSYAQGLIAPAPVTPVQPVSTIELPSLLFNGASYAADKRNVVVPEAEAAVVTYSMGGSAESFSTAAVEKNTFVNSKQAGYLKVGLGILSAALCALGVGLGSATLAGKGTAVAAAGAASALTPAAGAAVAGSTLATNWLGAFYIVGGLSAPYLVLTLASMSKLF